MKKNNKHKIGSKIFVCVIALVAIAGGYLFGNYISSKIFVVNRYANISTEDFYDDISNIDYQSVTPDKLDGAIVFQIAAKLLRESSYYEVIGNGVMNTSMGVTQTSYSYDSRNGDDLYFIFVTYSNIIKVAKESNYKIGGDVNLHVGTPSNKTVNNIKWSDKYENYTWKEYSDTFGKEANVQCSYMVSTKTVTDCTACEVKDGVYTYTLTLDPIMGSFAYIKQIAINSGVEQSGIEFYGITLKFSVDKNYKFVDQYKTEQYSMKYMGVKVNIDATIDVDYNY